MEILRILVLCCLVHQVNGCAAIGSYVNSRGDCIKCHDACSACETPDGKCTKCTSGKELIAGKCSTCAEGRYLDQAGTCVTCGQGRYLDQNGTCIACDQGRYLDQNGTCVACDQGRYLDQNGTCLACDQGRYLDQNGTCVTCDQGRYLDQNGTCLACDQGRYLDQNGTCVTCDQGRYLDQNGTCVTCEQGRYLDQNGTCVACDQGRYLDQNGTCVTCDQGRYLDQNGTCVTCDQGQYLDQNGTCIACDQGRYLDQNGTCVTCDQGRYLDQNGTCVTCDQGRYLDQNGTCIACDQGRYLDQNGTCVTCDQGRYLDQNGTCIACDQGRYLDQNGTCVTCDQGRYLDQNGTCIACDQGRYLDQNGTCVTCDQGRYLDQNGTCVACDQGRYLDQNGTCVTCDQGRYLDQNGTCLACDQGRYLDQNGTCVTCDQGRYLDQNGTCVACDQGRYLDQNGTCVTCDQGRYLDQNGTCLACDQGRYLDQNGTCVTCDQGRYLDQNGTCVTCEQGRYLDQNGTCVACDQGRYLDQNGTCVTCDQGRYLDQNGTCVTCDQGRYLDQNGTCIACDQGRYLDQNGTCVTCDQGRYLDQNGTCVTCDQGRYLDQNGTCIACDQGRYLDQKGACVNCSSACTLCEVSSNNCTSCPSSDRYGLNCAMSCTETFPNCSTCHTRTDPVTCASCMAGFILHAGSCQACPSRCQRGCVIVNDVITCKEDDNTGAAVTSTDDNIQTIVGATIGAVILVIVICIILVIVCRNRRNTYLVDDEDPVKLVKPSQPIAHNNPGFTDPEPDHPVPPERIKKRKGRPPLVYSVPGPHDDAAGGGKNGNVKDTHILVVQAEHTPDKAFSTPVNHGAPGEAIPMATMPVNGEISPPRDTARYKASGDPEQAAMTDVYDASSDPDQGIVAVYDATEDDDVDQFKFSAGALRRTPDQYTNIKDVVKHRIAVDKLQQYVNNMNRDDFRQEFKKLPEGLTRTYSDAMQNRKGNRYQKIYPYDGTRVKLQNGSSDYINATRIDCYNQYNTFIASLGPTEKTMPGFVSFWEMVWQEKVEVIVMLTNLVEASEMKCEQYWPDAGTGSTYGDVTVTCNSEDVYAEYVIRSFTVHQSPEKRALYHIHYTAWPDKGVPDDVTGLIEFRQRVISCPLTLAGPTLVHCSAGIGRTGTYIALDVLTRDGQATGSVDVFGSVKALRGQRVNMVQTAEQYEYLHNALVHSLTFESDLIQADQVLQLLTPSHTSTIRSQFEQLNQNKDVISEDEKREIADNASVQNKNRPGAEIPGNKHRPWLHLLRPAEASNYINAVFLNGFQQKNRYVVTQTPLPTTVTDFLTMVMQRNCHCIVSLDVDNILDKNVGVYLPAMNTVVEHGPFKVQCLTRETTPHCTIRQLMITAQGSQGQARQTVHHFHYTSWGKGEKVPKDAETFVQLTRDVERVSAGCETEGQIVVHCPTGAEHSALFCVVSILIQKMEIEQQVSVVNTVRQVKARRRTAIPNKEQYLFCHQCLSVYIQSFGAYSNFSLDTNRRSTSDSGRGSDLDSGSGHGQNGGHDHSSLEGSDRGPEPAQESDPDTVVDSDSDGDLDAALDSVVESGQQYALGDGKGSTQDSSKGSGKEENKNTGEDTDAGSTTDVKADADSETKVFVAFENPTYALGGGPLKAL